MRRTILALTIIFGVPTAAMALTTGWAPVGDSGLGAAGRSIQQGQLGPGGIAGSGHDGGNVILAKGDQSGTGPGHGGHKGAHKAEGKGGQPEGKAAKAGGKGGPQGGPQGGPAQPRR